MAIYGILASIGTFIMYFCMKYTYAARANSYAMQLSFKDVWSFSFEGHPMRRHIVPIKYIAIFFAFTGLFGWNYNLDHDDMQKFWRGPAIVFLSLNIWARMAIYEAMHWKKEIEKSISALGMLRCSIKEIGWFPQSRDLLSNIVNVTNALFFLVCLIRIFSAFDF